jgi:hypothetical protein
LPGLILRKKEWASEVSLGMAYENEEASRTRLSRVYEWLVIRSNFNFGFKMNVPLNFIHEFVKFSSLKKSMVQI